eukprot:m.84830 g.84830  ORF g.84830 m.84830 type:complete len:77 (-) comp14403_c0_seq2:630-860(-)
MAEFLDNATLWHMLRTMRRLAFHFILFVSCLHLSQLVSVPNVFIMPPQPLLMLAVIYHTVWGLLDNKLSEERAYHL